jgi:isopentenyldiphosphate isomerase
VTGRGDYREVRRLGRRHRITQVIVQNSRGDILLQQRGAQVHEAPGTWDVAAGGHVDPGQEYLEAALHEARDEIGLTDVPLTLLGKHYSEHRGRGEWVRRFNTVFIARYDGPIRPDLDEVAAVKWIPVHDLGEWIDRSPEELAPELRTVYQLYLAPMAAQASTFR